MNIHDIQAVDYADDQIKQWRMQRYKQRYTEGIISLQEYAHHLRRINQEELE